MTKHRRSENLGPTKSTLGKSVVVTFRIPEALYAQLQRLSARVFQPVPTLLRAAAVEYVAQRRPDMQGTASGLSLRFTDDEPPTIDANVLTPEDLQES
jgi:hypothetical protein